MEKNMIWYLAQIRPNGLNLALRNLERQGISFFCPLSTETSRNNGKFVSSQQPLFPGYLFVAIDIEAGHWRAVDNTRGISKLVSFGDKPSPVSSSLISELMLRFEQGGAPAELHSFNEGDTVKLIRGPFSELLATIEQVNSQQRVWLLLDVLGRQTRISVTQQSIRGRM